MCYEIRKKKNEKMKSLTITWIKQRLDYQASVMGVFVAITPTEIYNSNTYFSAYFYVYNFPVIQILIYLQCTF